jgi:hypothetical protein
LIWTELIIEAIPHFKLVGCLWDLHFDPSSLTGKTRLAVQLRFGAIVKLLIEAGADPTISNAFGWTCRGEAQASGDPGIAEDILTANGFSYYQRFRRQVPTLLKIFQGVCFYVMYLSSRFIWC